MTPKVQSKVNAIWFAMFASIAFFSFRILTQTAPPRESNPSDSVFINTLLFFAIVQTVGLVIYDLFYISRPGRLRIKIDADADEDAAKAQLTAAKENILVREFTIACASPTATGMYGLVIAFLGMPLNFTYTFVFIAITGLIYVRLRLRYSWAKLYLG